MHDHERPRLARLLAPVALVAVAAAIVFVVLGSGALGGDDGNGSTGPADLPAATEPETEAEERPKRRGPATYVIKANDTLSGIAEEHGTTAERLQELNPELDPQGLVAGQRIKLRE